MDNLFLVLYFIIVIVSWVLYMQKIENLYLDLVQLNLDLQLCLHQVDEAELNALKGGKKAMAKMEMR